MPSTMTLNCQLTVKGDGRGRYGHPKTDRTGPISEFLVDNTVFYAVVIKHLKTCTICDMTEVLKVYLSRRLDPTRKSLGMTSRTLLKLALSFEKLAKKKGVQLPPGLVNEFIWRCGTGGVVSGRDRLSIREKYNAFKIEHDANRFLNRPTTFYSNDFTEAEKYLATLVKDGVGEKSNDEELSNLLTCCEVQHA